MAATFDFSGHVVLVTGGTRGIGRAMAEAFADAGAEVTVTGTRADAGQYDGGLSGLAYRQAQMEDAASVDALAAAMLRVDVLVNNAGTVIRQPEGLTPDAFEHTVAVNLNAVFRLSQGLLEKLAARPGCIVNIASMFSYFASPHAPGYGAGKTAIVQLTKSLAALYAADGVRVNAIAPGWTETELTVPIQADAERDRVIRARTPMGRWGKPQEIAATALYLASDDIAGFVTGVTIPVDGGYSAT
jgi:NAD(P)-dependent dehydrogenase (short-subunit alcohol dehydrogenase family)